MVGAVGSNLSPRDFSLTECPVNFSLECEARSRRTLKERRKRLFGQVTRQFGRRKHAKRWTSGGSRARVIAQSQASWPPARYGAAGCDAGKHAIGARGRSRTDTLLMAADFESA